MDRSGSSKIPTNGTAQKGQVDWLRKARSRAWSTSKLDLRLVPLWAFLAGTFLAAGLFPIASGTFASLIAAAIVHVVPQMQSATLLLLISGIYLIIGIKASSIIERDMKLDDPSIIVADEVVGQWIALIPWTAYGGLIHALIAFATFRFFDIVKVWPASVLERRKGGFGVMMDDVIAGIYANIVTNILLIYFL